MEINEDEIIEHCYHQAALMHIEKNSDHIEKVAEINFSFRRVTKSLLLVMVDQQRMHNTLLQN